MSNGGGATLWSGRHAPVGLVLALLLVLAATMAVAAADGLADT